jgi:hypothetical protein
LKDPHARQIFGRAVLYLMFLAGKVHKAVKRFPTL